MNFRIFLVVAVGCLIPALAAFDFEAFRAAGGQALSWDTRSLVSTAEYPCPKQGFFVHPKNCSRFYRCVDFTNESLIFSRYLFECPEGNVFAQTIEACIPGVCPAGLSSIGQAGSGDGSTAETDSTSGSVDASGSVDSSGSVDNSASVDTSGSVDSSGSVDTSGTTDGSGQVEATDASTGQGTDGASAVGSESETGSGMEQGVVTNPSDAPMPETGGAGAGAAGSGSPSVACSADKPYKQSDDYCNIFYKCGFPDELYACNTGTAFSDDKQMCRLTSFEEELCNGKKLFVVSAAAFRDGFRWNDVAVFPSLFPIVANAIPFTFANLRTAVNLEDAITGVKVQPHDIPSVFSPQIPVDNSIPDDFGLAKLQETVKKLKEETEALERAGVLEGNLGVNAPSFQQSIHDDSVAQFLNEQNSNDFANRYQTVNPYEQASLNEPILGAIDTSTGEVFAAIPVGDFDSSDLTMRNSFDSLSQFQSSQSPGLLNFLQQRYIPNPYSFRQQGFAPNKFAYPSLYGSSQNSQTSYRPFASVVEYIPFSFNKPSSQSFMQSQSGSPSAFSQMQNSPFSFNQAGSPFLSFPANQQFSFNQASSPFFSKPVNSQFPFNQASSPFFSKPTFSQFSPNQVSSPFFSNPANSQFSFNQDRSPFLTNSQFSFGHQLPSNQFSTPFAINQINSPQLFRLPTPTPQLPFSQASSPLDLNSLLSGGMMSSLSNFNAEKAAEEFVNQYFAAALLENKNKNEKNDESTEQSVDSTPGQVTVDAETLEKLMSGQGLESAFGIPTIDSIIERPAIHGVAARNKAGDLFHVIPVNEHELAFLQGIEGLQSRDLDSALEIVPLTDELLSQMQVGDTILASSYKKK